LEILNQDIKIINSIININKVNNTRDLFLVDTEDLNKKIKVNNINVQIIDLYTLQLIEPHQFKDIALIFQELNLQKVILKENKSLVRNMEREKDHRKLNYTKLIYI